MPLSVLYMKVASLRGGNLSPTEAISSEVFDLVGCPERKD